MITKFLSVANACLLMNNFYSVFAIVGALGFAEVSMHIYAFHIVDIIFISTFHDSIPCHAIPYHHIIPGP